MNMALHRELDHVKLGIIRMKEVFAFAASMVTQCANEIMNRIQHSASLIHSIACRLFGLVSYQIEFHIDASQKLKFIVYKLFQYAAWYPYSASNTPKNLHLSNIIHISNIRLFLISFLSHFLSLINAPLNKMDLPVRYSFSIHFLIFIAQTIWW